MVAGVVVELVREELVVEVRGASVGDVRLELRRASGMSSPTLRARRGESVRIERCDTRLVKTVADGKASARKGRRLPLQRC